MAIRWTALYQAALREADPQRVPERCDLARRAIMDRLIELDADWHSPSQKKERLHESLRHLFLLERKYQITNPHRTSSD